MVHGAKNTRDQQIQAPGQVGRRSGGQAVRRAGGGYKCGGRCGRGGQANTGAKITVQHQMFTFWVRPTSCILGSCFCATLGKASGAQRGQMHSWATLLCVPPAWQLGQLLLHVVEELNKSR